MKLLLTSAGITNNTIKEALVALCNKKFSENARPFLFPLLQILKQEIKVGL